MYHTADAAGLSHVTDVQTVDVAPTVGFRYSVSYSSNGCLSLGNTQHTTLFGGGVLWFLCRGG